MTLAAGKEPLAQLHLPKGFRFHPTDEELVLHYLRPKAECQPFSLQIIADVDIYKFDPWNLPEKAVQGENEWYFFSPRDRKYPNGSRPNRAAGSGYWKATGTDKHIACTVAVSSAGGGRKKMGVKKALVFYTGRPPHGKKTNWIMHEYRLAEGAAASPFGSRRFHTTKGSLRMDDWVLCRIYKKRSTPNDSSLGPITQKEQEKIETVAIGESLPQKDEILSSNVEDFLASLPEIENSKFNQLQVLLPKLEENPSSFRSLQYLEQDLQSMDSIVMDNNLDDHDHDAFGDNFHIGS